MDIGKITALVKRFARRAQRDSSRGQNPPRQQSIGRNRHRSAASCPTSWRPWPAAKSPIVVQREVNGADPKNIEIRLTPLNKPGWVDGHRWMPTIPSRSRPSAWPTTSMPTVLKVAPGSPAEKAGIKPGDRVKKAELVIRPDADKDFFGKDSITVDFNLGRKPGNWAYVVVHDADTPPIGMCELTLADEGRVVLCTPVVDPQGNWFLPSPRGVRLMLQRFTLKSSGLGDAAVMGLTHTRNSIIDLYLTLRNLITGQLSVENLHGPLGIASVAYDFARQGLAEMSLFLGILSANLAVLNFLPIPVLDGGHMVFLIWEGVTRKRPSERVQIAATYFGMAFVLCLAILVFYLDLFVHHVIG